MRNETRHRLAGVHGVEEQRLEPGRHRHRLAHRVVELAVARRIYLVVHIDVARIEHLGSADHRCEFRRALCDPRALPGGVAPYANSVHRHHLADRPHAHQGARVGECAPRGAYHRVEPETLRPRLLHHLVGGDDVAEPAERRMIDAEMNHVRLAALGRERPGEVLQRRIRRGLILSDRKRMQRRAEQPVEQHVAGGAVEIVGGRPRALRAECGCPSRAGAHRPRRGGRSSTAPPR